MAKENWNRWGENDEVGAPNLITPDKVVQAASLVRTGEVLSLAQPLSAATPASSHRHGLAHFMIRDGGDYAAGARRPGGVQVAEDSLMLPIHTGTHIDALCHTWYDDQLYNGFSGDTIRSTRGATRCGVEKLPPIVTRGVLLDAVRVNGGVVEPGQTVSRAMLEEAARLTDVEIEPGDTVLIRTGWLESQEGRADVAFDVEPGIDVEAAMWLASAGAAIVGADNFAVEVIPFAEGSVFPVHQCLIRDHGLPLLEGLVLAPLAARRIGSFLFSAAPLPIVGGTGSPLTPLAVL